MLEHKPTTLSFNYWIMTIHFVILIIVKTYNFGIENSGIFKTDPRVKNGNMFLKHYCSRVKK